MADPVTPETLVTHTDEKGRTLSGMGADVEQLAETMERHAPPEKKEPEAVTPPATTEPPAEPAQPVSRGRQRFSDLTKERDEAKAAAEAAKAERETLARERDELRQRLEAAARTPEPPKEPEKKEPTYTRPEPTEDEIGTKYKTYAEFARDLSKWVYEQEQAAAPQSIEQQIREVLAREREHAVMEQAWTTSQDRGRKAYPDFDALLDGPAGKFPLANTKDEALDRVAFIFTHPQSEHIQYAIMKDPALAQRVRDSDAFTFGAIIAGLVPKEQPKSTWTPPPPPHPSVGASTPTTSTPSSEAAKKGNFDEYRNKRAAERGVKPRY
jgi:hypothetical protein